MKFKSGDLIRHKKTGMMVRIELIGLDGGIYLAGNLEYDYIPWNEVKSWEKVAAKNSLERRVK